MADWQSERRAREEPEAIRDMDSKAFAALANRIKEANHDAR
jgi:hypothetical protein